MTIDGGIEPVDNDFDTMNQLIRENTTANGYHTGVTDKQNVHFRYVW